MGWPKGKKQTPEMARKKSEALRGRKHTPDRIEKVREALRKRSKSRCSWTAQEWRRRVLRRDGHKCVQCGSLGPKFHVHHIVSWKKSVKLRFEVSNGQTLCASCHAKEGWKNKELSEKGLFKKGRTNSKEQREATSLANKGKPAWNKGKNWKCPWNEGRIPWNKGKPWSEEAKKKMSESCKGRRAWNKGIPCSEEMKKRISETKRKANS